MSTSATTAVTETPFETFLNQHDEEAWSATLTALLRSIHEVDKSATQIWFGFYPLGLWQALTDSEDPEKLARELLLQGNFYLKDQIDASHKFLYGHRYWPQVKQAVEQHADSWLGLQLGSAHAMKEISAEISSASLTDQILSVAHAVAASVES